MENAFFIRYIGVDSVLATLSKRDASNEIEQQLEILRNIPARRNEQQQLDRLGGPVTRAFVLFSRA